MSGDGGGAALKEEGKSQIAKKKSSNVEPLADADGLLLKPREYQVSFTFPASEDDRPTIAVLDACFAIPDPGSKDADFKKKKLVDFKNLRFSVHARSKIVLVGPNGCGKSTLLKLLMGDVKPDAGEVHVHRDLRIGRHDQHLETLFDFGDERPSESRLSAATLLEKTFGVANQDARRLLGQSGLESSAHVVPFAKLSGGQKSRVAFAALCAKPQNLLLLDEPTNHLDLESVEALIDGLNTFEGGVVVSTHDARLAEGLDDAEIWLVGAEGSTTGVDVLGRAGDAKPFARLSRARRRRGGGGDRRNKETRRAEATWSQGARREVFVVFQNNECASVRVMHHISKNRLAARRTEREVARRLRTLTEKRQKNGFAGEINLRLAALHRRLELALGALVLRAHRLRLGAHARDLRGSSGRGRLQLHLRVRAPVSRSRAVTVRSPLVFTSNCTSILGSPFLARSMPVIWNSPSRWFPSVFERSPSKMRTSISSW